MAKEVLKTGGDCDTWCGRCKMELAHTIVAMVGEWPVQVICNTCGSKHKFKKPKSARVKSKATSGTKRRSVAAGAKARSERAREMTPAEAKNRWLDLLAASPHKEHRRYTVKESFSKNDTLMHSKFGVGIVMEEMDGKKVRVLFEDCEKVLVINYGKK